MERKLVRFSSGTYSYRFDAENQDNGCIYIPTKECIGLLYYDDGTVIAKHIKTICYQGDKGDKVVPYDQIRLEGDSLVTIVYNKMMKVNCRIVYELEDFPTYPKILKRPDDKEEFINVEGDIYMGKKGLEEWPNHLHHRYPYELLKRKGFHE